MLTNRDRFATVWMLTLTALSPIAVSQVRTTGEIRGTVTDFSSALTPGVNLKAKDLATGIVQTTITSAIGAYAFLNLQAGAYEVTASAPGFQTTVLPRVVVETARTVDVNIQLTVGSVTETIEVTGEAAQLETTSNTIATTIRNDFIQALPLTGRDTLQFAALMAGAQSPAAATRNSTFNGLPNASLNITIDGINNNSQRFKSGGTSFFGFTPSRVDAIEEVTTSTTGAGADAAAGGAMNIRFTTKRGTRQYHGRLFHQLGNDALNANAFFSNARGQVRAKVRQNDFGGNLGGPLPIPGMKNKLFFFINIEDGPRPGTANRTVDVLTESAQRGVYSYIATDGTVRSQNVLQLATNAAGIPSQVDPTVKGILDTINGTVSKGSGTIPNVNNPNYFTLQWRQATSSDTIYPTARLDYQIASKLAWHGTWNLRANTTPGTPNYPGLSGLASGSKVTTYIASTALDWAIKPTMLNTFNFGVQSNHEDFNQETSVYQWKALGNRRVNLGSGITAGTNLTQTIPDQTPWIRNSPVYNLYDNLNWVKGRHTFIFGGSYMNASFYETTWNNAGVLNYNLGVAAGDPIGSALPQSLFPGIRTQDLNAAWVLYATLTGRISGVNGSRNVNEYTHKYEDFAPITHRFGSATGGLYFQDSFRVTPRLTLNYGFRWEISGAKHNLNNITTPPDLANFFGPSTGLFQPGVLNGVANPQLTVRPYTYSTDKVNPAPNFGFAWNPKLLGSKTVIRGSYGINYYDEGLNTISNRVTANPGTTQAISLTAGTPGFAPGGLNLSSQLPGFAVNPASFSFPLAQSQFTFISGLQTTKPELHTPYVQNWNFGIQREVRGGLVVEARYVGNKATYMWHSYSLNETNIFENGFLQEFRNAQRNLQINQAAGVSSFENMARPGQVALPILTAAFGARGSQPALAAGSGFSSGTFVNNLTLANAGTMADSLATNNIYFCRLVGSTFSPCANLGYNAPGPYPINFFRPNPYVTGLTLVDDNSYSTYHGLQIELRKAFSHGLTLQANYTWSKALSDLSNLSDQAAADNYYTLRNRNLDKAPTPFDLRHVFMAYWTYQLPFGKGSGAVLNRIVAGWTLSGIHRLHSGASYRLTGSRNTFNNVSDSGVILNGLSVAELQDMMRSFRPGPNLNAYSTDPRLTSAGGRANPEYLRVPATPGEFAQLFTLYGTPLVINDMALEKIVPIKERVKFAFQIEASNIFNHPVLNVGTTNIDSTSFGQSTSPLVGARSLQIRARVDW